MNNLATDSTAFLDISALLTGFQAVELAGTGMVEVYYQTALNNSSPADNQYFYIEATAILALNSRDPVAAQGRIKSRLMPNSSYGNMAKKIILMWYTGQWFADPVNDPFNAQQISGASYVQGLMWTAAQTHPPGAKQPGFASWAEQPITISTSFTAQG